VHGYGGAVVGVWRSTGSRWEGDFEAEDRFVGGVGEFVFVDDRAVGVGGAGGWGEGCVRD